MADLETPPTNVDAPQTPQNQQPPASGTTLVFPSDVRLHGHFVMFESFEYTRGSRGDVSARKGQSGGRVILPLPDALDTGYNAQYTPAETGFFGTKMAAPAMENLMAQFQRGYNNETIGQGKEMHQSISNTIANWGSNLAKFAPGVAGYAALDLFENTQIGMGVQLAGGFARNPHMAMLFRGVDFRQHSFQYSFVPRDEQESRALRDIIRFFKTWMHPSFNQVFDNNLFMYPHEFEIDFNKGKNFLFKIGESVLTNFNVSYHATGKPVYFASETEGDSAPVAVNITMSFTETSIVTREDIQAGR